MCVFVIMTSHNLTDLLNSFLLHSHWHKSLLISVSYTYKEWFDHAVCLPALWLATVTVDGCLNDSHDVITKLQLGEKHWTDTVIKCNCYNRGAVTNTGKVINPKKLSYYCSSFWHRTNETLTGIMQDSGQYTYDKWIMF